MSIGAEPVAAGGVDFRVWAPGRRRVTVVIDGGEQTALAAGADGCFSGIVPAATVGSRYRFQLDTDRQLYPDPASRFQPEGPHGPSMVIDPAGFAWTDRGWRGVAPDAAVFYELHVDPAGAGAGPLREERAGDRCRPRRRPHADAVG